VVKLLEGLEQETLPHLWQMTSGDWPTLWTRLQLWSGRIFLMPEMSTPGKQNVGYSFLALPDKRVAAEKSHVHLLKRTFWMRYLVTGGAGFIGSNIVDELVRRGQEVVVLDDLSSGNENNLAAVRGKINLRIGSITDLGAVQSACASVDFLIHLAARTSVPQSVVDPVESNHVNIDGTLNVLVAARDAKVKRFVFAASSSAYGESAKVPKTEAMPAAPISPYGVTKLAGELYAQVFGRAYGLENTCLRYFNVFGPRQDPTSQYSGVLSRFMLAVIRNESPVIYGDGEQSRDFIYIANVVDMTLRACVASGSSGMVINGGTGARISLNQVLALLQKITGKKIQAEYDTPRAGDIKDSQADISLAREVLGYQPVVDFEQGLKRTWDWYASTYQKA
jgi:nucleoside-diphosphate-sugar epimerase